MRWSDACKANDVRPVFGVSLYVSPNILAKKPVTDLWTFYAIDEIKAVNDLVRLATSQFRYTPLLTIEQALNAVGVIKVTGHRPQVDFLRPVENLYIPLTPALSKGLIKKLDNQYEFIQWQENRYPLPDDALAWEVSAGRNASIQTWPQHIFSDEEWSIYTDHLGFEWETIKKASANLDNVLASCTATLKIADLLRPKVEKTLRQMCVEGAPLVGIDLSNPVYAERLETELSVIQAKKFEDYFFIVADLMQWANKNQLVGPARGSSAGSLVCFLLGITKVDPIKYGLLFFRFLDINRTDWPDIDGDFADRDAAIDYLVQKYGVAHVAKLGTLGGWQTKNSSNEVAKALGMNKFDIQPVIDSLPKYAANDKRNETALAKSFDLLDAGKKFISRYPEFRVVTRMIGSPSNAGTHASGVLLTNEHISNYVAVDSRTNTASCDLVEAERLGMIKLDVLGLKTLAILDHALQIAGLPRNHFDTLELNDQKVFDVINDKKFLGVNQFEGPELRKLAQTVRIDRFDDLSVLSALSRPGAVDGAPDWVKRRKGEEAPVYLHEKLKPYFEKTLANLVFQEQIMLVAHDVAGMDWPRVTKLRKAISKSQGDAAMAEFGEEFIGGLVKNEIPVESATKLWTDILRSGSYLFNESHSVSYGILSYWCCYMKAYYPVEFAAAALTLESDNEKMLELLRELDREGVKYIPIDMEHSTDKWRVVNGKLIGPLTLVRGIGSKKIQQILSARARNEPLPDSVRKALDDPKTAIDSLYPVQAAIDKINLEEHNILSKPLKINEIEPDGTWRDNVVMIGCVRLCAERDENEEKRIQDRLARGDNGYINGQSKYVELRLFDDTEEILAKIGRKEYEMLAPKVLGIVEEDKTLVCIVGTVTPEIKMLLVKRLKIIGEI